MGGSDCRGSQERQIFHSNLRGLQRDCESRVETGQVSDSEVRRPVRQASQWKAILQARPQSRLSTNSPGSRVQKVRRRQYSQGSLSVHETTLRDLLRYRNIPTCNGKLTPRNRRSCRVSGRYLGDRKLGGGPSESTGRGVASSGAGRVEGEAKQVCFHATVSHLPGSQD